MFHVRTFWRMIPVSLALTALLAAVPARAEGFFDIYFGVGLPEDGDVDVHTDDPTIDANPSFQQAYPGNSDFEWETTPSTGMRGGYWFEQTGISFIGVGLDLSYYRAYDDDDFASLDVWLTPITPLLMLRAPLGYSEDYPGGRVQPYVAVGPGFTVSAAHADLSELGVGLDDFEDVSLDVGLDARAGLAVQLSRHFALFGEYRYTYVEPDFDDSVDDGFGAPDFEADVDFEPELATHHIVFGASFRF